MSWISYYREPRTEQEFYVMKNSEDDWEYTEDSTKAFEFRSWAEAIAVTPRYDGSSGIMERAGVREINLTVEEQIEYQREQNIFDWARDMYKKFPEAFKNYWTRDDD